METKKEKKDWKKYWKNFLLVITILFMIGYIVFFTILWEEKWNVKSLYGGTSLKLFGLCFLVLSCLIFASNRKKFSVIKWILYFTSMFIAGIFINAIVGFVIWSFLLVLLLAEIPYNLEKFKSFKIGKKNESTTSE